MDSFLGLDIGASRFRIAQSKMSKDGTHSVRAVASRQIPDLNDTSFVATLLSQAYEELQTKERRCVCGVGTPQAAIHIRTLPKMTVLERHQAARFHFAHVETGSAEKATSMQPFRQSRAQWIIGEADRSAVDLRLTIARAAGLRVIAIDYDGFALFRSLSQFDAILDIGYGCSRLYRSENGAIEAAWLPEGGASVTQEISRQLSIDLLSAEKRKRIIGVAGLPGLEDVFAGKLSAIVESLTGKVCSIGLTGNGSRLAQLPQKLTRCLGVTCEPSSILLASAFGDDIVRANASDWALAIGLSLWERA